jgi:hypothetical protein
LLRENGVLRRIFRRNMDEQKFWENCIMRTFITCTFRQI